MNKVTIAGIEELPDDELEIRLVLRGTPEVVIGALAHGLPRHALEAMRDALGKQLRRWKICRTKRRKG